MVRSLIRSACSVSLSFFFFFSLFPSACFAAPVIPEEPSADVLVEQPPTPVDQPNLPAEEPLAPEVVTLYDEDGLALTSEDTRVVAPEALASIPSSVYGSVTPSTSYANFAASLLPKLGFSDDYVFFRSGENEFIFVHGAMSLSGTTFSGDSVDYERFYYGGSSRGYLFDSGTGSLSLDTVGYVVLSNLGDYPTLTGADASMTHVLVFVSTVALCLFVISRLLSFTLRTRLEVVSNAVSR